MQPLTEHHHETGSGRVEIAAEWYRANRAECPRPISPFMILNFGSEANALVVRPDAGHGLCEQAILKYLPEDAPAACQETLAPHRESVRSEILRQLQEMYGGTDEPAI